MKTIGIMGGDRRLDVVANGLRQAGFCTHRWGAKGSDTLDYESVVADSDTLVLPYPMTQDKVHLFCPTEDSAVLRLDVLFSLLKDTRKTVIGGRFPPSWKENCGFFISDFEECESLLLRNADATAEAAVFLAMRDLSVTLRGSRAVVVGYGRIGKSLCAKLLALGAQVTVAARRESALTEAELFGCDTLPLLPDLRFPTDTKVLFNTVPAPIFSLSDLQKLPAGTLLMDLASPPGGWNHSEVQEAGLQDLWATGLPGKCVPDSAGAILLTEVKRILADRRESLNSETQPG